MIVLMDRRTTAGGRASPDWNDPGVPDVSGALRTGRNRNPRKPVVVEETSPEENAWNPPGPCSSRCCRSTSAAAAKRTALLARAELLEEQFNNPLGASKLPDEVPEKRRGRRCPAAGDVEAGQTGPPQPVVADRRDLRAGRAGMADGTGTANPQEERCPVTTASPSAPTESTTRPRCRP